MKHLARWTAVLLLSVQADVIYHAAAQPFESRGGELVSPLLAAPALASEGAAPANTSRHLTRVVVLSPKAAEHPDMTHAALLITNASYADRLAFGGRVQTVKQNRVGSQPNPWECAWLVWNYTDDEHFYYIAIKPTGWELGKRDPAYPGGQRFLASGEDVFPIGEWHSFLITQESNRIVIRLNDIQFASFTDNERPYLQGKLGLYSEDAEVLLDDITAPFAEDFEGYGLLTEKADGFVMNGWVSPYLGHGYIEVADRRR